jgi:hypothetical protein
MDYAGPRPPRRRRSERCDRFGYVIPYEPARHCADRSVRRCLALGDHIGPLPYAFYQYLPYHVVVDLIQNSTTHSARHGAAKTELEHSGFTYGTDKCDL